MSQHFPIVPYDPFIAAVAFANRYVLEKKRLGKSLPEHPYAKAFFKGLTGESQISAKQIQKLIPEYKPRGYGSKESILSALDICIMSNGGSYPMPLSTWVRDRLFPEARHRQNQRWQHRSELSSWQSARVSHKKKAEIQRVKDVNKEAAWNAIKDLPRTALKGWFNHWASSEDSDPMLDDQAVISLLNRWFDLHVKSDWGFSDLYYKMSPGQILWDLSLPPE